MNSLFVYGTLKEGEIAFNQIENMVAKVSPAKLIDYQIGIEDNLPKIFKHKGSSVNGELIQPRDNKSEKFFKTVQDYEGSLYYKFPVQVESAGSTIDTSTYVAHGKPGRGFAILEESTWYSRKYPYFSEYFPMLFEQIKLLGNESHLNYSSGNYWNYMDKLQGQYLKLISFLENYCLLVFGSSRSLGPNGRLKMLGKTKEWALAFHQVENQIGIIPQEVSDARSPSKKYDNYNSEDAIQFFYQIRNNISHQGKSSPADLDIIYNALKDLSLIIRELLIIKIDKIEDAWFEPK
jgi:gamma-glutamylcyclotransferase (GGCT)/AIG2-like uncharacterized protein YtfP